MNFSVGSSDLLKALSITSGALGSASVIYILEDFLFDVKENKLTITASNMEITITTSLTVQGLEDGKAAVPGKILQDTLKALPAQPINFSIPEGEQILVLESSIGQYKMACDNTEDYPQLPVAESGDELIMPSHNLQRAITNTLLAISNDEMRLAMTGLYTQVDFDKVTFVATDAHKLVKYSFGKVQGNFSANFIIPKKALALLKTILPTQADIKMSFDRNFAFFGWDNTTMSCRLIDAKFPDYNVVIPVGNPYKLVVDRESFLSSMKRINIYANKTTNQVALSIADRSLTIFTRDIDFSNEAVEQLSCIYEGEPMDIGFNARFVIEMLGVLDSEEVTLELSQPNKAGLIIPSDLEENEDLLMLVMPVMIPKVVG